MAGTEQMVIRIFFFIYISNVNKGKITTARKWAKEMGENQNKGS